MEWTTGKKEIVINVSIWFVRSACCCLWPGGALKYRQRAGTALARNRNSIPCSLAPAAVHHPLTFIIRFLPYIKDKMLSSALPIVRLMGGIMFFFLLFCGGASCSFCSRLSCCPRLARASMYCVSHTMQAQEGKGLQSTRWLGISFFPCCFGFAF